MEFSYDSEDPIFESDSNDSSSQGDVPIAKKILFKKWKGETISQAREREGQMTSKVWEVRFDSVEIDTTLSFEDVTVLRVVIVGKLIRKINLK